MASDIRERRSERLEVRIPPSVHMRVSRAAALRGQTVAAFVMAAVNDAARRAIEDDEVTRLNGEDFDRLLRDLDAIAEPNAALGKAAERYRASQAGVA